MDPETVSSSVGGVDKDSTTPEYVVHEIQRVRELRQVSDELQELRAFREVEDRLLAREDRERARQRSRSPLLPQVCF